MKKFYIIESMKPRKSGHVSHLMVEGADGILYELSPRTGKKIDMKGAYWTLNDYLNVWNYKIVEPEDATFTGAMFFPFFDYLKDNNII